MVCCPYAFIIFKRQLPVNMETMFLRSILFFLFPLTAEITAQKAVKDQINLHTSFEK